MGRQRKTQTTAGCTHHVQFGNESLALVLPRFACGTSGCCCLRRCCCLHLGRSDSSWCLAALFDIMLEVQPRRQLRVGAWGLRCERCEYMRVDVSVGTVRATKSERSTYPRERTHKKNCCIGSKRASLSQTLHETYAAHEGGPVPSFLEIEDVAQFNQICFRHDAEHVPMNDQISRNRGFLRATRDHTPVKSHHPRARSPPLHCTQRTFGFGRCS
jgi:hypothetical protein